MVNYRRGDQITRCRHYDIMHPEAFIRYDREYVYLGEAGWKGMYPANVTPYQRCAEMYHRYRQVTELS